MSSQQFQYGQYGNPAFGVYEPPVDYNQPVAQPMLTYPPASQVPAPKPNGLQQGVGTAMGAANTYQLGSSLFGSGSAAAPAAATTGTATTGAGAVGAGSSLASIAPVALPAAAAIYAVGGTMMGGHDAIKQYRGHDKQGGAIRGMNAIASPTSGYMGRIPGLQSRDVQNVMALTNPITAPLALADMAGLNFWGSNPDKYQRMGVKKALDAAGLGNQLQWQGAGGQTLDMRKAQYNTDPNNQFTTQAIDYANPFAYAFASQLGDDKNFRKMSTDLTGQIANTLVAGATSAEDVRNNILGFIQKLGIQPAQIRETIKQMIEKKLITAQEGEVFNANISNLVSGKPYQSAPAAPAQANQGKPATPMAAAVPPKGKPSTPMSK